MVQKEGLDRILTALPGENGNGKTDSHGNVHDSNGILIGKYDISRERLKLPEVNEFGLDSSEGIHQNYMRIEFEKRQLKLFPKDYKE